MVDRKVAIYPGTFDPVHLGHIDVVRDASRIFSRVIWAVGTNPVKNPMFTAGDRIRMVSIANEFPNVKVVQFTGFLVDCARAMGAEFIVRSLRMAMDFENEFQMSLNNKKFAPELISVYLPARQEHFHISSTVIREQIMIRGMIDDGYVPENIRDFIKKIR
ncbi:MAG: pantetheine-phosphate adenylyltransferase [bacterium]|nr:pantetheine-phosphate adenylyltransferase [bacterium]